MLSRACPLAIALLLAACATDDPNAALVADAERIRHLSFAVVPAIEYRTREEYTRTSAASAAAMPEERIAEIRGIFGRLGYFSATDDVRAAVARSADFYGAFYQHDTKSIEILGEADPSLVVHELVHALQDQHFDIAAFQEAPRSTDEAYARRAVVEGDAMLAQLWHEQERAGQPGDRAVSALVKDSLAERWVERVWTSVDTPRLFTASSAFVYGYGARYVAQRMGMPIAPTRRAITYAARDEAFTHPPRSTQEIIAGPNDHDPIVEVGLRGLPPEVSDTYAVSVVDRLGEWHMRVLDAANWGVTPYKSTFNPEAWDGDQLVVLAARGADGKASGPPLAVVWTSAWDTPGGAHSFADMLARRHALKPTYASADPRWDGPAADGEWTHLRVRDKRVVFVKNLDPARAVEVGEVALGLRPSSSESLTRRATATMQRGF